MSKPKPAPKDDAKQSKRFEDAARDLEADQTGAAFQRAVGVVIPKKKTATTPRPRKAG